MVHDPMVESEPLELEQSCKELRRHAIMLLTRREHSAQELSQKLIVKGYDAGLMPSLLQNLMQEGLQSDSRFAESYMRFRREKGFGPIHIQQELQQRGVSADVISAIVDVRDTKWLEYLESARKKRFGQELPQNLKDRAKQTRFLAYRGFSQDQISGVFSDDWEF